MRVLRQRVRSVLTTEVASGCKTALAVQAVLSFSLCHLLERGNLPEEVSFWLSRAAKHFRACIHIRHDARLRGIRRERAKRRGGGVVVGRQTMDPL